MPRGGKTKPVAIHRLQGTYQPIRHARRAHEPEAQGDLTKRPPLAWMTRGQKERWVDILSRAPQGVLADIDQEQFAAYVVHVDVFVEAAKARAAPFQQVNSSASEHQRQFEWIVATWPSCSRGRRRPVWRSSKRPCFFISR